MKVRVSLIINPHFRFWFLIKHASAQHSGHSLTEVRCVTSSTNFSVRSVCVAAPARQIALRLRLFETSAVVGHWLITALITD